MAVFFLTYAILVLLVVSLSRSFSTQTRKPSSKARFQRVPSKSGVIPSPRYESTSLRHRAERRSAFDLA
jgi:hypothetical protein